MYVCVCKAVTERQIFAAAKAGAKNMKDLKRELGVGSECGRCASCAKACLREAHHQESHHAKPGFKTIPLSLQLSAI